MHCHAIKLSEIYKVNRDWLEGKENTTPFGISSNEENFIGAHSQLDILERLKASRIALGYDQLLMGKILGVMQNSYSQIENGRRHLTENHIRLMEERANLNKSWLLTGTGSMFCIEPDKIHELIENFKKLSSFSQEFIFKQILLLKEMEEIENLKNN